MTEIHVEFASVTAKPPLRALADVILRAEGLHMLETVRLERTKDKWAN